MFSKSDDKIYGGNEISIGIVPSNVSIVRCICIYNIVCMGMRCMCAREEEYGNEKASTTALSLSLALSWHKRTAPNSIMRIHQKRHRNSLNWWIGRRSSNANASAVGILYYCLCALHTVVPFVEAKSTCRTRFIFG